MTQLAHRINERIANPPKGEMVEVIVKIDESSIDTFKAYIDDIGGSFLRDLPLDYVLIQVEDNDLEAISDKEYVVSLQENAQMEDFDEGNL